MIVYQHIPCCKSNPSAVPKLKVDIRYGCRGNGHRTALQHILCSRSMIAVTHLIGFGGNWCSITIIGGWSQFSSCLCCSDQSQRYIFFDPVTSSPIHSFRSNLLRGIIAIANIIPYLHKLTVLNSVGINRWLSGRLGKDPIFPVLYGWRSIYPNLQIIPLNIWHPLVWDPL